MMILDYQQVAISNLMMHIQRNAEVDENMLRHMILNSIRMYNSKHRKDYGELVIACDDRHYWRKDIFPYYKAGRRESREDSGLDWNAIFGILNKVRDELKEYFPYKVIQVPHAEADDIIGTIVKEHGVYLNNDTTERVLILSGDKDFGQLQKYVNVEQYSPMLKKWIKIEDARTFLREHIMRGDKGDGIPNFLSNDSCFVMKERQKPISKKKLDVWVDQEPEQFCDDSMLRNYKRNQQLIDLDHIPDNITDQILDQYKNYEVPERRGLLNYFIKNKLKNLMDSISDF